ncbi:MAG: hypothetical protein ACT4O6_23550 [Reyranella sp.]
MDGMPKRGRGRPKGTGKMDDQRILLEVAGLIRADSTLKPTTAFRQLIGGDNPSAIRRLQEKWRRNKSLFLDEARHMEIEQYDAVHHANAPRGTLVRLNARNEDHWRKASLAGFSQERGLSNLEWIMRRDFPQGFLSPEDAPKYFEQCGKLMGDMLNGLCLSNPPYSAPAEW